MEPLRRHNIPTELSFEELLFLSENHFTFLNFLNYLQIPFSTYNFTFTLRIRKNSSYIISSEFFNISPIQFYSFLLT